MSLLTPTPAPALPTDDPLRSAIGGGVRVEWADAGEVDERRLVWVDAVEDLVVRVASAVGLAGDAAFFLGVAVREAVVNAIRHGAGRDGACQASVTLRITRRGSLVVSVQDRGRGFDPAALPDPLCTDNLCRGSGRGIFYIRRFADRVTFSFPRGRGTVVRIEKRLPKGAVQRKPLTT